MWARILSVLCGFWLMAAPAVLDYGNPARANDRITGPIAAAFAIIAIWQATRPLRVVDAVAGVWLVFAPLVWGYGPGLATLNSVVVGLVLVALAFVRGAANERIGGGWSSLWRSPPPPRAA